MSDTKGKTSLRDSSYRHIPGLYSGLLNLPGVVKTSSDSKVKLRLRYVTPAVIPMIFEEKYIIMLSFQSPLPSPVNHIVLSISR